MAAPKRKLPEKKPALTPKKKAAATAEAPKKYRIDYSVARRFAVAGRTVELHPIYAVNDIPNRGIKAGHQGGWVQGEHNLSQEGDCWIDGDAMAFENARVTEDATLSDDALAYGDAVLAGGAYVVEYASVCGKARVDGDAEVGGRSCVVGEAHVGGSAVLEGQALVGGRAVVKDEAHLYGCVEVGGDVVVGGDSGWGGGRLGGGVVLGVEPASPEPDASVGEAMKIRPEWREWEGGECPVDGDDYVVVTKRNGDVMYGFGRSFHWLHYQNSPEYDITAYAPIDIDIEPYVPKPKPKWTVERSGGEALLLYNGKRVPEYAERVADALNAAGIELPDK